MKQLDFPHQVMFDGDTTQDHKQGHDSESTVHQPRSIKEC